MSADHAPRTGELQHLPPVRVIGAALWPFPPIRIKRLAPLWFGNAYMRLEDANQPGAG
jgi:hypothetical protein